MHSLAYGKKTEDKNSLSPRAGLFKGELNLNLG